MVKTRAIAKEKRWIERKRDIVEMVLDTTDNVRKDT